jgi:hypothetical protein
MENVRPLRQSLPRFYVKLLVVGLAVAAAAAGVWSLVLLVRGRPVTYVEVSNALFWTGAGAVAWVTISLNARGRRLGQAEALRVGRPISPEVMAQENQHRRSFAWYAGAVAIVCMGMAILLPFLLGE